MGLRLDRKRLPWSNSPSEPGPPGDGFSGRAGAGRRPSEPGPFHYPRRDRPCLRCPGRRLEQAGFLMDPASYDHWYDTPKGRWTGETEYRLISRDLRALPGESLLDAGCGTGWFSRRFFRDGLWVTGVDRNMDWLAFAREKSPEGLSWIGGDLRAIPRSVAGSPVAPAGGSSRPFFRLVGRRSRNPFLCFSAFGIPRLQDCGGDPSRLLAPGLPDRRLGGEAGFMRVPDGHR